MYTVSKHANGPSIVVPTQHLSNDLSQVSMLVETPATVPFTLPQRLADEVRTLSERLDIPVSLLLQAAFQLLLYRSTGQDDILLGTLKEDPRLLAFQKMSGFSLNTLILRTDLSGNPSFLDLLERVRQANIVAEGYAQVPFHDLVKELFPDRSPVLSPLQVFFTFLPLSPLLSHGWNMLTSMDLPLEAARFDLSLDLEERPDGLVGRFVYNTDVFEHSTIERMLGHWQVLLAGIVDDPSRCIDELPLLTGAELQTMLLTWNATASEYPRELCVHQLFEAQVERTPDAIAVVFEKEKLSYRELNERANQLAHHLLKLGAGPDVPIGICIDRSVTMLVGLLGILKSGSAYVPLDAGYPPERLAFMLQDTQAPVLVTTHALSQILPAHNAKLVYLDTHWPAIALEPQTNLINNVHATDLAYVIYTSGSTGNPKGVMIPHRGLVNYLSWCIQAYAVREGHGVPVHSPLGFDLTITSLFSPLLVGQKVILLSQDQGVEALYTTLRSGRDFSLVKLTPAHLKVLNQWLPPHEAVGRARALVIGGEALSRDNVSFWHEHAPDTRLINEYGPTETVVGCCVYEVPAVVGLPVTIPIGRPIANTQLYILNSHLQPVPINVPGELYIGGDGLARGYLNQPELTQERFIPHPFSDESGARIYKTGDLARYRADGNIEFLGRLDHQVKVRGFRIEPGEIEAVLQRHQAVREAVVVAREDDAGDRFLVAYVVLHREQTATIDDLRLHATAHLPSYMLPSNFVLLETFPITPNGKVDRNALPLPLPMDSAQRTFVAPTLLAHQQLISIWEELLDARPIGITDNFFHLGGHSLLAATLIARIEQVFGQRISLSTLFAGPTIEDLAKALSLQENARSRTPLIRVQSGHNTRPFFFLHGDWTGGAFYCFTLARALGKEQAFYVLEPYNVDHQHAPSTLEAMAGAHIQALRTVQPQGPYLLGGFCNGGLLAYEIARQLDAEGQLVDLLLISPTPPGSFSWMRTGIGLVTRVLGLNEKKHADWFLRLRHALRHVYRQFRSSDDSRLKDFNQLLAVDPRLATMFPPIQALYRDYVGVFTWLRSGYRPTTYPGKITCLWSQDEPSVKTGWSHIAAVSGSTGIVIPGEHMDGVTTYIDIVSAQVSAYLKTVQPTA